MFGRDPRFQALPGDVLLAGGRDVFRISTSRPYGLPSTWSSIHFSSCSTDSGECEVAPRTPNPPARLTAATTSRQWLKASSGNSIPSMSQIGEFHGGAHSLLAAFLALLASGLNLRNSEVTLAHQGPESQAGFLRLVLRAEAIGRDRARAHSVWQNMQPDTQHPIMQPGAAVLSLALLMRR